MRNKPDERLVANRRMRLKQWIDDRHEGRQADFIDKTGINQGELSALLSGKKSFGEKKARNLENDAGMPADYLDRPSDDSTGAVPADIADFIAKVKAESVQRELPEHIQQSILTLIASSPKKKD